MEKLNEKNEAFSLKGVEERGQFITQTEKDPSSLFKEKLDPSYSTDNKTEQNTLKIN